MVASYGNIASIDELIRGDAVDRGRDPPVVLYSHEDDWEAADDALLRASRKVVASSFTEFLEAFAAGTVNREPSFGEEPG